MQKNKKDEEEKIMEAGYEKAAEEDPEDQFPPGFRFHPTDEELITYYLAHKINKPNFTTKAIAEVDLNKCEPWDLPGKAKMGEREWYFFSSRDRKYPTGARTNRATMAGYWKTTGKDKEIYDSGKSSELAGMKKTLVFYRGRAPRGEKTNWVMHEYRLHPKSNSKANLQEEWVVCRVILKSKPGNKKYSTAYQAHRLGPPVLPNLFNTKPTRHQVDFGLRRANPSEISMADIFRYANGLRSPFPFSFPPPPAASLNLNVDTQQYFAPPPSALLGHMASPIAAVDQSTLLPQLSPSSSLSFQGSCTAGSESGYCGGGDGRAARFMNIEPCVNMEGYWSAY